MEEKEVVVVNTTPLSDECATNEKNYPIGHCPVVGPIHHQHSLQTQFIQTVSVDGTTLRGATEACADALTIDMTRQLKLTFI